MKIAIISVTEKGRLLSGRIAEKIREKHEIIRYCFEKKTDENAEKFSDIKELTKTIFHDNDALIFVCACGIAVRSISPFVDSKETDPAVLVADDSGKFVIPILSGHIGGANRLAEILAEIISAAPIITTATDIGKKFSPDSFACANNLLIHDLKVAKDIASAVLDGEKIGVFSDYPCINKPNEISEDTDCSKGICISCDVTKKPFEKTLNLVPKNIVVGIGCKRGISFENVETNVLCCLEKIGADIKRVCRIATIDIKKNENGLLEFCKKYDVPLFTYNAEELMQISGNFIKSDFVLKQTGTDNVCERSAVKCSEGKLVLCKTVGNGVTVAMAEMAVEIDFGRKIL